MALLASFLRKTGADRAGWLGTAVALLLALGPAAGALAAEPWRIVMLPGTDPSQRAAVLQDRAFRQVLQAAAPNGVEFYTDALDGVRFQGEEFSAEYFSLLAKKYQQREVDLVVAIADFALDFAERYHEQLWPGKPVLVLSIEETRLRQRGLPAGFAYVPWRIDIEGTLGIAEALQPGAKRLVIVAGTTPFDTYWAKLAAETAGRRTSRHWTTELWTGIPMPELRERLAALDRSTAVIYTSMYRDREGHSYFPFEAVKPMAEVSGAPIYGWYPTYLEEGLTAGSILSFEESGRVAARLAAAILGKQRPAAGATMTPSAPKCMANGGRLEALHLDANTLPPGCEVAFRPPSLWRDYRGQVIGGLALLVLQGLTITGLLVQRHRRHQAETEAAQRRLELGRAARVATVGELSASIAHEVGQPLGAIVTNTEAAQLILGSGVRNDAEIEDILADVRRDALRANEVVRRLRALLQKQAVEFAPLDLVATVDEALALLAPEARRRGVTIERNLAGSTTLTGDRIQLQQVVLNLAINAMDAIQESAEGERVVSVSLQPVDRGVELRVADRGRGITAEDQARLFESFFTTKPHGMGLGLSIVRTVVNAHGGRVWAAPREGGGSVFTVWLPVGRTRTEGTARAGRPLHAGAESDVRAQGQLEHS